MPASSRATRTAVPAARLDDVEAFGLGAHRGKHPEVVQGDQLAVADDLLALLDLDDRVLHRSRGDGPAALGLGDVRGQVGPERSLGDAQHRAPEQPGRVGEEIPGQRGPAVHLCARLADVEHRRRDDGARVLGAVVEVTDGEEAPRRTEVLACAHHRGEESSGEHGEDGVLHLRGGAGLHERLPVVVLEVEEALLEGLAGLGQGGAVHCLGLPLRRGAPRGRGPGCWRLRLRERAPQAGEGLLDSRLDLGNHARVEVEDRTYSGPGLLTPPVGQRSIRQVVVAGGLEAGGRGALEGTPHVLGPQLRQGLHREPGRDQEPRPDRHHAEQGQRGQSAPEGSSPPALRVVVQEPATLGSGGDRGTSRRFPGRQPAAWVGGSGGVSCGGQWLRRSPPRHSARRASWGSTRVARFAGRSAAATVIPESMAAAASAVGGSDGATP